MYKRLRVVLPATQVLVAVVAFAFAKLYVGSRFYGYFRDSREIVMGLNFPLAVLWIVVFYPITALGNFLPPVSKILLAAGTVAVAVLLVSSVALFWYLVVREVEMRRAGTSMLRCSGMFGQLLTATVLLCCGGGAIFYSYAVSSPLWHARPVDAVLEGSFPTIWGIVFIAIAVHDLLTSLRNRAMRLAGDPDIGHA